MAARAAVNGSTDTGPAIVVDTDTQLITAVEVLHGNAPDNLGALELVEQSEANTGVPVEEAMGDAAYGDGDTKQDFADEGRTLIARVPGRPNRKHFPKEAFQFDGAVCEVCPLRTQCFAAAPGTGRTVQLHPQEALLQQARVLQQGEAFGEYRQRPDCRYRQLLRQYRCCVARANLDPHFARVSLPDQILLPDKGFPAGFLGE